MTFGLMLRKYLYVHGQEKYNLKSYSTYIDPIFLLTEGISYPLSVACV